MSRRPQQDDPELLRQKLVDVLNKFEHLLARDELREKVLHLIPAFHTLRDLGTSIVPVEGAAKLAARRRILLYLRKYVGEVIDSDELMVVSGIQDYPRRIRELRVEKGWPIITGMTAKMMSEDGELAEKYAGISPRSYVLLRDEQDRDAAHRWRTANDIRKQSGGAKSRLLAFFRENVGVPVTGEELVYVAKDAKNWQRRVRELRTEEGWPIFTRLTGGDDLPAGSYILREDRQSKVHDRKIPDSVRIEVLERDGHACRKSGWRPEDKIEGDPRQFLELHHIQHHAEGGANTAENLVTLCNVYHDELHRLDPKGEWDKSKVLDWLDS